MMRPHFCSRMPASAGCTEKNAPVRLTASVLFQSSSETSSAGALSAVPALATTMSNLPRAVLRALVEPFDRSLIGDVGGLGMNVGVPLGGEFELFAAGARKW